MREKALILLRGKAVYNGPEHPSEVNLLPRRQPEAGKHLLQRLGNAGGGIIQYAGLARGGIHHQPVQLPVLLRKAPVLLLDEATSGLDMATERRLLDNLRQSGLLRTCFLVTHRPESAKFCGRTYEIRRRQVTEVTNGT